MTSQTPEQSEQIDSAKVSQAWRAFMAYRGISLQAFDAQAHSFDQLPPEDQALIPQLPSRLSHAAEAIEHNADLLETIAQLTGITEPFVPQKFSEDHIQQTVEDFSGLVDSLLSIVRDWSTSGENDRSHAYDPIIQAVQQAALDAVSTDSLPDVSSFSVLVPGASLGRLPWELARLGCFVQGVEKCFLHLFICSFILNGKTSPKKPLHLYPFTHHTGIVNSVSDQITEMHFPDADPRELHQGEFSMVAGEFLDHYNEPQSWHCVATCFYIDNTHSIIAVIARIAKILKPGGIWINHGSLDFRYDDSLTEPSVEITKEELDLVIARSGLRVIKRDTFRCRPPYAVTGIVSEEYQTAFTIAVRV